MTIGIAVAQGSTGCSAWKAIRNSSQACQLAGRRVAADLTLREESLAGPVDAGEGV